MRFAFCPPALQSSLKQAARACSCCSGWSLLRAGFSVREAVAADHDRNQTRDLGDGPGEEGLNSRKPGVEGRSALGMCSQR
jgi:hypothetical protein